MLLNIYFCRAMEKYFEIFINSFTGYFNYLISEISQPSWNNYFYWLIGISLFVWILEIFIPWRKSQKIIRNGLWMDTFYLFFNFFIFSLVGYNAISNIGVELFNDFLGLFGITNLVAIEVQDLPTWSQLLIMFVIADFIQWSVHVALHKIPWLWEFHKVHHSVKEMGYAAHFRFHFMETVFYKTAQYIPLAMIGFGIQEFIIVHLFSLFIGHLNHANLGWGYGVFGYIFNSPKMHIWHHAKKLPSHKPYGMNFGISLSIWDYIFKTAYVPSEGKDIELGFDNDEDYPQDFIRQMKAPFQRNSQA